jgi:hypothetical protein
MADEQPVTPSTAAPEPDAAAPEPSSDRSEAKSSESPSWWQRIFRRPGDDQEARAEDADKAESEPTSKTLALSQEELDRRVQAETDRREAKRAQEARARAKRELRDKDPWAYAEQERKDEELSQSSGNMQAFLAGVGTEHDRVSIDPLFLALPKAEQERIQQLDGAGVGLTGRKLVVTESLKALEKHWKAEGAKEAETKLRRNPAFRKQLLTEARGRAEDPDLLPALGGPSEADKTVSGILRQHYRLG